MQIVFKCKTIYIKYAWTNLVNPDWSIKDIHEEYIFGDIILETDKIYQIKSNDNLIIIEKKNIRENISDDFIKSFILKDLFKSTSYKIYEVLHIEEKN